MLESSSTALLHQASLRGFGSTRTGGGIIRGFIAPENWYVLPFEASA
jgi:hypothetical protein